MHRLRHQLCFACLHYFCRILRCSCLACRAGWPGRFIPRSPSTDKRRLLCSFLCRPFPRHHFPPFCYANPCLRIIVRFGKNVRQFHRFFVKFLASKPDKPACRLAFSSYKCLTGLFGYLGNQSKIYSNDAPRANTEITLLAQHPVRKVANPLT